MDKDMPKVLKAITLVFLFAGLLLLLFGFFNIIRPFIGGNLVPYLMVIGLLMLVMGVCIVQKVKYAFYITIIISAIIALSGALFHLPYTVVMLAFILYMLWGNNKEYLESGKEEK